MKTLEDEIKVLKQKNAELQAALSALKLDKKSEQIRSQHEQLVKYNKELEQFTYVATHDLKSPLANIQGYLELLELDIEEPSPEVADSLKWLKYSVKEAKGVISELTNALKARNNKDELLVEIDLEALVESILSGMRSRILALKIVFICDFTEINHFLYYPVALRSILQNIISNAIQYIGDTEHPEITVKTVETLEEIHISIKDNGVGIDLNKNKTKVFGLFKRITDDQSGSGIGMFIVQKLLENYGGQLTVKSDLGEGSTFTVIIPKKI